MVIPLWMLIAKSANKIADNQTKQIDNFNKNQQYTPNGQPTNRSGQVQTMNNVNMTGNSDGGLGNAFSTFSSIYGNYLDDKKKKLFQQ